MISRGNYVLLLPEDAPGLEKPEYGKVVALSSTAASIEGVPDATCRWTVPREIASERLATASDARGAQPGQWLRKPVAAHLSLGWVHGQVVGVAPAGVTLRHGDTSSECAIKDLIETEPIITLLLWDVVLPRRQRTSTIRRIQEQVLDRLLGATGPRQPKPSRDIASVLTGLVPDESMPDGDTVRSWVESSSGVETAFPLQHAVDFVYVRDSNARRIAKSIRDSVGASFCRPPPTGRYARPAAATPEDPVEPEVSSPDSFFAPEPSTRVTEISRAELRPAMESHVSARDTSAVSGDDYHSRIVRALASQPELLLAYLDGAEATEAPPRKRQRCDELPSSRAADKASKYAFQPTSRQVAVHEFLVSPSAAGKSADDFMDLLISHSAVQFAPHPGVLIRLYDFQFGTRGLSILHFGFMDRISKMSWVKSRKANMLNFSHAVALPEAAAPSSTGVIAAALSSLQTYCSAFMAPEVGDLVRTLHAFVQQEVPGVWSTEDLQHYVFWIDGVLESFRDAAVHDLGGGGATRLAIQATIVRSNPDFQATVQLLTQRRLAELLRSAPQARQDPRASNRARTADPADAGRQRHDQSRHRPDGTGQLQHVPRQGKLELCLRSISRSGCVGVPGHPSQCIYPNRSHFVPTTLHAEAGLQHQYRPIATGVQAWLMTKLSSAHKAVDAGIAACARKHGLAYDRNTSNLQSLLSELTRRASLSLCTLVRLVRGETEADSRPNKALDPSTYERLLDGFEHRSLLISIARHGFRARWLQASPAQLRWPSNHRSASSSASQVIARIREGEATGAYIVADIDVFTQWGVHVSPFGAIAKKDPSPDSIRLIHDLSSPAGQCPNDLTDTTSLPPVKYEHVAALATRIEALKARFPMVRILILKGDVHGAFRHLRQHAADVHWMGGLLPDRTAGVIDLAAPFGWTGSPAFYAVFGQAISHLVGRESPASMCTSCADTEPFFPYEWVDDHIMIEADLPDRCRTAEDALRLAMLAILGPTSINEDKFTTWATKTTALGLEWDTDAATVSIPIDKIAKALSRVQGLASKQRVSKHEMESLLGSLRHVATCLHAARPFYQRLHLLGRCAPRYGSVSITHWARDDLVWFEHILQYGTLRGVPTRLFGQLPQPDVHFYMDASNFGACMLDPARKSYIIIEFDANERKLMTTAAQATTFDINVREQLCIALAATLFAPVWSSMLSPRWPHVRCWTDNRTAMARTNALRSNNRFAQNLNRCIGLAEAQYRFRVTATHLPGTTNALADAGSRLNVPSSKAYFTNGAGSGHTPVHLQGLLGKLQAASLARSSRTTYDRTWRQWCTWRASHGEQPQLPRLQAAHSAELISFAMECWAGSVGPIPNAAATVLSKISHVAWHHLWRYGYTVQLEPNHALAVRGMRRLSAAPSRKSPITPAILRTLRDHLTFDDLHDRVIWGATVMGFFFLLRRSEYLAVDGKISTFAIQRRDVVFMDDNGRRATTKRAARSVTIRIRGSKTDQLREATTRTLHCSGSIWLCPVRAAWSLVEESRSAKLPDEAPLCMLRDGTCISAADMTKLLKLAAAKSGYDSSKYGTHSLRSGGATALFTGGNSDTTVKLHGRWKSDCFQRYVHIDHASTSRLATTMLNDDLHTSELSTTQWGELHSVEFANNPSFPARR